MNCMPIAYHKSEAASRGLARRILEPLFATHAVDAKGTIELIMNAVGHRCNLGNAKSLERFGARLSRNLGPRFVSGRYCAGESRRKHDRGFSIITFGVSDTPQGPALKLMMSVLSVEPNNGYRVVCADAFTVPRHALERMIMRGGVRDIADVRRFLGELWNLNEAMITIKSAEFRKREGRIMLPPVHYEFEGEAIDVVPILDRSTGVIVTFINDKMMGARRSNWLRRMIAIGQDLTVAKLDPLLAESEVILAETRQEEATA